MNFQMFSDKFWVKSTSPFHTTDFDHVLFYSFVNCGHVFTFKNICAQVLSIASSILLWLSLYSQKTYAIMSFNSVYIYMSPKIVWY